MLSGYLSGGDAGMKRFSERVYGALVPGRTLFLEAQPRKLRFKARKLHPGVPFTLLRKADFLIYFPRGRQSVDLSLLISHIGVSGTPGPTRASQ